MHDLTLITLIVAGFVGTECYLIKCSNGQTK